MFDPNWQIARTYEDHQAPQLASYISNKAYTPFPVPQHIQSALCWQKPTHLFHLKDGIKIPMPFFLCYSYVL